MSVYCLLYQADIMPCYLPSLLRDFNRVVDCSCSAVFSSRRPLLCAGLLLQVAHKSCTKLGIRHSVRFEATLPGTQVVLYTVFVVGLCGSVVTVGA